MIFSHLWDGCMFHRCVFLSIFDLTGSIQPADCPEETEENEKHSMKNQGNGKFDGIMLESLAALLAVIAEIVAGILPAMVSRLLRTRGILLQKAM
jgi:hypothetical protein